MVYKLTGPALISTSIKLPASKSISNRALIIHALSKGSNVLSNLSDCDDTKVMIRALRDMPEIIDVHASGTAMRFLTAYLSLVPGTHIITGTERMKHRPIKVLVDALRALGANIEYNGEEGFPPLRITGRNGNEWNRAIELPGNVSSQYISALLMIGPYLKEGLNIKLLGDIVSKPYINLTLDLMNQFGGKADWVGETLLTVKPQPYKDIPFTIESDWSAASYWYEMIALSRSADSEIKLKGLFKNSSQGDSEVAWIFNQLGVQTEFSDDEVIIKKGGTKPLRFEYNFINQPDLTQTFAVTCAMMDIPFHFNGLQSLKIKETDRLTALVTELKKLGISAVQDLESVITWKGDHIKPSETPINTYEDHRMAMAFAPAGLIMKDVRINNPEVISKSYPHYWEDLKQAGFNIEENE
ncbi:MAG: 3-phosphoshikimate 1-carboxyvinyltransferase [Phocaeicola sp.]|uniref:3-phosphoshikimate 1-carboxyvinyltransferase n=1 Tax=Phocaeicola sp. TaxID=2773926 RepID=UPI003FA17AE8